METTEKLKRTLQLEVEANEELRKKNQTLQNTIDFQGTVIRDLRRKLNREIEVAEKKSHRISELANQVESMFNDLSEYWVCMGYDILLPNEQRLPYLAALARHQRRKDKIAENVRVVRSEV